MGKRNATTTNGSTGAPLTPEQRKLCSENIRRLQAHAARRQALKNGQRERIHRAPPTSLLDLAGDTCPAESVAAIPLQRVL